MLQDYNSKTALNATEDHNRSRKCKGPVIRATFFLTCLATLLQCKLKLSVARITA